MTLASKLITDLLKLPPRPLTHARKQSHPSLKSRIRRRASRVVETVALKIANRYPFTARRVAEAVLGQKKHVQGSTKRISRSEILINLLCEQAEPEVLANCLLRSRAPEDALAVIEWFNAQWARRDSSIYDLVRRLHARELDNLDPWLRLACADIIAAPVGPEDASRIIGEIASVQDGRLQRRYVAKSVQTFLRNDLVDELITLIDKLQINPSEVVTGNSVVTLARKVNQNGTLEQREFLSALTSSMSDYDYLKLCAAGFGDQSIGSHEQLLGLFLKAAAPTLKDEFLALIAPAYNDLGPRFRYGDVRRSSSDLEELRKMIADAVTEARPFAALRLGDGEAYIFPESVGPFSQSDREMRERHWWNINLDEAARAALCERTLAAYQQADVVGIPTIHRFIRDFSARSETLTASTANRGVVTSVLGTRLLPDVSYFTEERFHHLAFDGEFLSTLIARTRRLVIASSIAPRLIETRLSSQARSLEIVQLPTHAKTLRNKAYVSSAEPLPLVYDRIAQNLAKTVQSGDLVLVSGGIAAKSLVAQAKRGGAVALDIGGQLETIVGLPNGAMG